MITYVADIADDIDDIVAINFLHNRGLLASVVLDGYSNDPERERELIKSGIPISDSIQTSIVFCGGGFGKLAECHKKGFDFELVVLNGFFAGKNVFSQKDAIPKFKDLEFCRSYNPNLDIQAARYIAGNMSFYAVSKDVCHHPDNVPGKWHGLEESTKVKKMHDLLMVKEGLRILTNSDTMFTYSNVDILNIGDKWSAAPSDSDRVKIVSGHNPKWSL